MFWGFSEAIDFNEQQEITVNQDNEKKERKLNILLLGSSDPRHILKTIAKLYKTPSDSKKINFYLYEHNLSLVARQMLLTLLALEPLESIALKNKILIFMDIYGNTLMRPASFFYVCSKARALLQFLTSEDNTNVKQISSIFEISKLSYKERDILSDIIEYWKITDTSQVNYLNLWDQILRKSLGDRYDHRDGMFDFDYYFYFKDHAERLTSQEYKFWRNNGIAFVYPEYKYSLPNKTLIYFASRQNSQIKDGIYNGDMFCGPFPGFGFKTTNQILWEQNHIKENKYRSTDITFYNLYEIFYEIQYKCKFENESCIEKEFRQYGNTIFNFEHTVNRSTDSPSSSLVAVENIKAFDTNLIPISNVKIIFLSANFIQNLLSDAENTEKFDIVFVSHGYFHILNEHLFTSLGNEALIFIETCLYRTAKKDAYNQNLDEIKKFANQYNLKILTSSSVNKRHAVIKLLFKRNVEGM